MSAASDKRRFPREHRRAKVTLGAATLFTTDISSGGSCVELMRVLARDSSVNGTLHAAFTELFTAAPRRGR